MLNNAILGMTTQSSIAKYYKLGLTQRASRQFSSAYDIDVELEINKLVPKIFKEIGSDPVRCTSYEKSNKIAEDLLPYNFLLKDGRTLKVKTSLSKKSAKWAPNILGQAGYSKLNYYFGNYIPYSLSNQNDIKKLILENIGLVSNKMIDYLFISDVILWIYLNKFKEYEYMIIYRGNKPDLEFEDSNFTFSKESIELWNECNTIKYNGKSLFVIQVHKNRTFKFRVYVNNLIGYFKYETKNNETLGMSVEKIICDISKVDYPDHLKTRSSYDYEQMYTKKIELILKELPEVIEYSGAQQGSRGGNSKCSYDFVLKGNKKLSLKTNKYKMVCPPDVGQPSDKVFLQYFKHLQSEDYITPYLFKKMVITHTSEMMKIYLLHLLDSDFLLWMQFKGDSVNYEIIEKLGFDFIWVQDNFTFTRGLYDWNESTTCKYNGLSIGEFQVHSSRNCYKFRFNFVNLITLIN